MVQILPDLGHRGRADSDFTAEALLEWNFHLGKAAGCGSIHRDNRNKMLPHKPPRGLAKNHDRDVSVRKVLLIADVLVGRHQKIEASFFGKLKQCSV